MSEEQEEKGFDMSLLIQKPEPEQVASDEPDEVEDQVEDVDEPVDEVETDEELPESDEPQSDPGRQSLIDKELQQIQQLRATLAREVDRLQKQGDRPTEKQVERVEKAQSKLDKLLSEQDLDPYQAPRDIAEEVLADRSRAEQALQNYEGKIRALEEREAQREAQMARLQFSSDHPELRGRYDEFADKTQQFMVQEYGEDLQDMRPNVFVRIANREFMRLVDEAKAVVQPEPEKKKAVPEDSSKKPKAANIIKTKSGGTAKSPQSSEAKGEALLSQIKTQFFGG